MHSKTEDIIVESVGEMSSSMIEYHLKRLNAFEWNISGWHENTYRYVFRRFVRSKPKTLREKYEMLKTFSSPGISDLAEETSAVTKDFVLYTVVTKRVQAIGEEYIAGITENAEKYLCLKNANEIYRFQDVYQKYSDPYHQLKLACKYAVRKKCTLLIANLGDVLFDALFYDIINNYGCELQAVDFPLLNRKNLPVFLGLALYKDIKQHDMKKKKPGKRNI